MTSYCESCGEPASRGIGSDGIHELIRGRVGDKVVQINLFIKDGGGFLSPYAPTYSTLCEECEREAKGEADQLLLKYLMPEGEDLEYLEEIGENREKLIEERKKWPTSASISVGLLGLMLIVLALIILI